MKELNKVTTRSKDVSCLGSQIGLEGGRRFLFGVKGLTERIVL